MSSSSQTRRFLSAVARTIATHHMIPPGANVLVAFSAGPDSTALLHALWTMRRRLRCRLCACHVHHGLRGRDADGDARHAARVAASLEIPFVIKHANVRAVAASARLSLETAARQERYRLLEEAAAELRADLIATGHTADDQAETILFNLVRGAGPEGLSGIPPVRGHIIRPLLSVTRAEVEAYCRANGLRYRLDRSNQDLSFTRNRLRHQVLPLLKTIQPAAPAALARLADIMRAENELLTSQVAAQLDRLATDTPEGIRLPLKELRELHLALQRRLLRAAISRLGPTPDQLTMDHLEAMLQLLAPGRTGARVHLPGACVSRTYRHLIISRSEPSSPHISGTWVLPVPGELPLPDLGVCLRAELSRSRRLSPDPNLALLDRDTLTLPLIVRTWRPGDRFVPLGMASPKKLQDFFVDQKVPSSDRGRIPLVLSGQEIVWVVGHRISEHHKVTERTRHTVRLIARQMEPSSPPPA